MSVLIPYTRFLSLPKSCFVIYPVIWNLLLPSDWVFPRRRVFHMEFCENAAIYLFQYHTLPSSMDCNNCLGGCYYTVKYFHGRVHEQQTFFVVLFPFFFTRGQTGRPSDIPLTDISLILWMSPWKWSTEVILKLQIQIYNWIVHFS